MNQLIIVSFCVSKIEREDFLGYRFKFDGVFKGVRINKIDVKTTKRLKVNSSYFLTLKCEDISENCLTTILVDRRELKMYNFH